MWHRISEAKPVHETDVLITNGKDVVSASAWYLEQGEGQMGGLLWNVGDELTEGLYGKPVTHWMSLPPLPAPPIE